MGDDKTDGDGVCCKETKEIGRGGGSYIRITIFFEQLKIVQQG